MFALPIESSLKNSKQGTVLKTISISLPLSYRQLPAPHQSETWAIPSERQGPTGLKMFALPWMELATVECLEELH